MGNLPKHFRARRRRGKIWYYFDAGGRPRKEIPLGSDYRLALRRWAELKGRAPGTIPHAERLTVRWLVDRYLGSAEFRALAPRTQRDYLAYREPLLKFFDAPPAPVEAVRPQHVRQYLSYRKDAQVRANREKAFLSLVWNWARGEGLIELQNPTVGIRRHTETGRRVYVTDAQFRAAYEAADEVLRDVLDLSYLTGQRIADVLKFARTDLRGGTLWVRQNKTGAAVQVGVEGELAAVIARITARRYPVQPLRLVVDEAGRPITYNAIRLRWRHLMRRLGEDWQLRDLRAKAVTDTAQARGLVEAQTLAGHGRATTTDRYIRRLAGAKVRPTR